MKGGAVTRPDSSKTPLAKSISRNLELLRRLEQQEFPRRGEPQIITISNQKGGVGKTTSAVNLAAALALGGLRVLVIDADPQGNASTALGVPHEEGTPSTYDVMVDAVPLAEVVVPCPDVDGLLVCPATIDLAGAEVELVSRMGREYRLDEAIRQYLQDNTDVDVVLIDCPPSLGLLTINAFAASDEVLIPIQTEYYALEGLSLLWRTVERIREHLNPRLHIKTILLTMVDGRTNLSSEVASEVREHFPQQVLQTEIPRSVRISEAPSYGQTVVTYEPRGSGAVAYRCAALELSQRLAEGR